MQRKLAPLVSLPLYNQTSGRRNIATQNPLIFICFEVFHHPFPGGKMFTRSLFLRSVGAAALVGVLSLSAFADTIRLKDGSIIKGKITGFTGGRFTVVIGEGPRRREMVFSAGEIESIQFDSSSQDDRVASAPVNRTGGTPPRVVVSDKSRTNSSPQRPLQMEPEVSRQPEPEVDDTPAPIVRTSTAKPIEVNVKVLADNTSNGWTNSGWVVKKGQRIRISGTGTINIGGGRTSEAGGLYDFEDPSKLLRSVPTGALIAVIGDDNNDFIYVGTSREFIAERDGSLFLGVNEGNLKDNSGSFDVKVEIVP
jgi:hypothetical protein